MAVKKAHARIKINRLFEEQQEAHYTYKSEERCMPKGKRIACLRTTPCSDPSGRPI